MLRDMYFIYLMIQKRYLVEGTERGGREICSLWVSCLEVGLGGMNVCDDWFYSRSSEIEDDSPNFLSLKFWNLDEEVWRIVAGRDGFLWVGGVDDGWGFLRGECFALGKSQSCAWGCVFALSGGFRWLRWCGRMNASSNYRWLASRYSAPWSLLSFWPIV